MNFSSPTHPSHPSGLLPPVRHRRAASVLGATRPRAHKKGLKQRSGYDGAAYSRLIGNWFPGNVDFNALISQSSPQLRARVRDLVRNFPPFARAVNGIVAFTVGKGARFQSLALTPDGKADNRLRQAIETGFRDWMEQADVSGQLHFYEMQQLVKRQECEGGESISVFTSPRRRNRGQLAIQMFESEALNSYESFSLDSKTDIYSGIEYDVFTGERLAYHFTADIGWQRSFNTWREPAENVIHTFNTLRPGQFRGITPFAPSISIARDMGDYTGAELDAAKMGAKWLGMVKTNDPLAFQGARPPGTVGQGGYSEEREDIDWLENATIEYLRDNEDIVFAPSSGRPGDSFDRFIRFCWLMVAVTMDLPYEILSGDYTQISYSTSKASRNDFAMFLAPHHFRMEHHFTRPVFRRWLAHQALMGKDYMRGYYLNPWRFERAMWIPAGMPSVDPLRDGKAMIDLIAAGLKSPQQAILENGGDPEEVVAQIAAWVELCKLHGVNPSTGDVSTSLANNPAKLGAPEQGDESAQKKEE